MGMPLSAPFGEQPRVSPRPPKQAARCAYTCCVPAGRHEDGAESGDTDEDETAEAPGLLCLVHVRADLVAAVRVRVRRRAMG